MTRRMFYDLALAAFLAVSAYAVITSLSGCAGTDYKGVGTYKQDPPLKTRADIRAEERDKQYGPAYEKLSKPNPDNTAALEAKIDALQATVNDFMRYQTYHTEVQAKDRANAVKRDACYAACEKRFPYDPDHKRSEREQADADACWKPCQALPQAPGGGGC